MCKCVQRNGTATNSGIVGEDNFKFGWLKRYPYFHDVPCKDIILTGENYRSKNFLKEGADEEVMTGAYVPFGITTSKGQVVKGGIPCSGSLMRISPNGGKPELVAWGFRNPFGLALSPDGALYVTDNMYDARGNRPVFGAGDLLWKVEPGRWYGWPDRHGHHALYEGERYKVPGKDQVKKLLLEDPGKPPDPTAIFGVHASANGFDFSRSSAFGHAGNAFVALFGDETPTTGKVLAPVGFKVVRVDIEEGVIYDFAVNKGKTNGPASKIGGGGFERPVAARFDPSGNSLYIVDFGVMLHDTEGARPQKGTGVLWRILRRG
jgi:glucose/arabinose dehydrogenase